MLEDFQSFLPGWKSEKRNEATTWPQLENEIIKYQVADYDGYHDDEDDDDDDDDDDGDDDDDEDEKEDEKEEEEEEED